jgi:hypothetical protein
MITILLLLLIVEKSTSGRRRTDGGSEFCICGRHLTDYGTSTIATQEPPTVICKGKGENASHLIRFCHCDEFRPYRLVREEVDEEKHLKQNLEREWIRGK